MFDFLESGSVNAGALGTILSLNPTLSVHLSHVGFLIGLYRRCVHAKTFLR